MGLFGKGLIGLILDNKRKNEINRFISNSQSYGEPPTRSSYVKYQCIYCGIRKEGRIAPNPRDGGKCRNSPYGTHYWTEY